MVMLLTACPEVTEILARIVPYWNIIQVKLLMYTCKQIQTLLSDI